MILPLSDWRARHQSLIRLLVRLAAAYVVTLVLTTLLAWDPDPVRLALVFLVVAVSGSVVLRLLDPADRDGWGVITTSPRAESGRDQRTMLYLRIISGHLTTRTPDGVLRDRVADLADRTLAQRHGLRLGDPRATALLGDELVDVVSGEPRLLDVARLDRLLTRIERL